MRAMAATIACDIHPLNNVRVLQALRQDFGAFEQALQIWIARWIREGFAVLQIMVRNNGRGFLLWGRSDDGRLLSYSTTLQRASFPFQLVEFSRIGGYRGPVRGTRSICRCSARTPARCRWSACVMATREIDAIDRKLLHELQRNASIGHAELAERVGASTASCWRRMRALEADGVLGR